MPPADPPHSSSRSLRACLPPSNRRSVNNSLPSDSRETDTHLPSGSLEYHRPDSAEPEVTIEISRCAPVVGSPLRRHERLHVRGHPPTHVPGGYQSKTRGEQADERAANCCAWGERRVARDLMPSSIVVAGICWPDHSRPPIVVEPASTRVLKACVVFALDAALPRYGVTYRSGWTGCGRWAGPHPHGLLPGHGTFIHLLREGGPSKGAQVKAIGSLSSS